MPKYSCNALMFNGCGNVLMASTFEGSGVDPLEDGVEIFSANGILIPIHINQME